MTSTATSPLAQQVAGFTAELRAHAATSAGVEAALRALICACLLRIMEQLEHLITLWQSGHLPPIPHHAIPNRANQPTSASQPAGTAPSQHSAIRQTRQRLPTRAPLPASPASPASLAAARRRQQTPRDPNAPDWRHLALRHPAAGRVSVAAHNSGVANAAHRQTGPPSIFGKHTCRAVARPKYYDNGTNTNIATQFLSNLYQPPIIPTALNNDPSLGKARASPWTHQGPSPWTSYY